MNLHTPRNVSLASDEVRYRSAHPTDQTIWRRRSDSNGWCLSRALRVSSAVPYPLGHVSMNFWWGWRESNSHAQRRWFLRPVCLPFPPHPHYLLTPLQPGYTSSDQVPCRKPVDKHGRLPGPRTLKMSQLLRLPRLPIPPEAQKGKAPRFVEGLLRSLRTFPKSAAPLHTQQIAELFGQIRVE